MTDISDNADFDIANAMCEAEKSGEMSSGAADVEQDHLFPVHVLPEQLASFIQYVARSTSTDLSMAATYLWPALGSAIGLTRTVYPPINERWQEPPLFYSAVVAESGMGKSPVFDAVFKPHQERQRLLFAEHERLRRLWEHDVQRYKSLNEDKRKGQEPPQEPRLEHILTSDATTEGVEDMLKTSPRGILVMVDELSGWLAGMDAYRPRNRGRSSKDRAFWLEAHGGLQHKVDRKGRGSTLVPRAGCCVAGGIQPAIFKTSFNAGCRDSGLLARFLLALPSECDRELMPGVPEDVHKQYDRLVRWLLDVEMEHREDGLPAPKSLPLSDEAQRRFGQFVPEWDRCTRQASGLRAAGRKLEGGALRFALVLRLVDEHAERCGVDHPVEDRHLEAGITLAWWYFAEAERVYALWDRKEEPSAKAEHPALTWWKKLQARGSATPRQWRGTRRGLTSDQAREQLEELARLGMAERRWWRKEGAPGRQAELYFPVSERDWPRATVVRILGATACSRRSPQGLRSAPPATEFGPGGPTGGDSGSRNAVRGSSARDTAHPCGPSANDPGTLSDES